MDDGAYEYRRFLQGDTDALENLIRAYSDSLVRYAYCFVRDSAAAEDVMEDTFAALIVKRKKFVERAPFTAYLFRIARNKCMDYLRSNRSTDVSLSDLENVLQGGDVECEIVLRERNEKIYTCLMSLKEDYRDVLYLTYFEGFPIKEIQSVMRKTCKQVYNLLARAKSSLKEILLKEGIGYEDL